MSTQNVDVSPVCVSAVGTKSRVLPIAVPQVPGKTRFGEGMVGCFWRSRIRRV